MSRFIVFGSSYLKFLAGLFSQTPLFAERSLQAQPVLFSACLQSTGSTGRDLLFRPAWVVKRRYYSQPRARRNVLLQRAVPGQNLILLFPPACRQHYWAR